ncbi:MAG: TonB family protein [Gemmatirosa sp.]|nr:TonB family protein [Gemmatirosa sp.]
MFTRFSAPRPRRAAPFAGTCASLAVHGAFVVAIVGGGAAGTTAGPDAAGSPLAASREGIHWVGLTPGNGTVRPVLPRPGAHLPIAYVVPGRGPMRNRTAGVPGPAARAHGLAMADDGDPPPAERVRADLRRADRPRLDLPLLPSLAEVDAAMLVPGVLAAAPDPARLVSRADEFVPLESSELVADSTGRMVLRAPEALRAVGHVDELPIALVTNPRPAYPAILAHAQVGGRVLVEFRIDSVGAVDLGSLRVLQSTHALFTQAVRAVLPHLRFLPAQLGAHSVGVTVRQPFLFTIRAGV